jgi:hypothetical protein
MILLIVLMFTLNMAMENNPDEKTVRVFYIQPNDIPLDSPVKGERFMNAFMHLSPNAGFIIMRLQDGYMRDSIIT